MTALNSVARSNCRRTAVVAPGEPGEKADRMTNAPIPIRFSRLDAETTTGAMQFKIV
jgi:hypothetical protein